MDVCYISNADLGANRASAVHVVRMCNAMSAVFGKVFVVSKLGESKSKLVEKYGRINFICFGEPQIVAFPFFRFLVALVCLFRARLVYSRWTTFAILYPFLINKYRVLELHALQKSFSLYIAMKLIRLFGSKVEYVFITNKLMVDFISVYPWIRAGHCHVLPDGADPVSEGLNLQMLADKLKVCGYVGSFSEGKGVEKVVALAKRMPDFSFVVAGGTDLDVARLKNISPPNVVFLGYVQPSELSRVFDRFSIALLPNSREVKVDNKDIGSWTSPLKMFEYMAAGKVIVASDLPVLREILIDGVNSILVEPDNIDQWELSIRQISKDLECAVRLVRCAQSEIANKYSWSARALRLRDILGNAANK